MIKKYIGYVQNLAGHADPDQPRTSFNQEEIQHLANSIRDNGQLHPIRFRWNQENEKWFIVSRIPPEKI